MIPRAIIGRSAYVFESETAPAIADWERQRKCLTENPDNFDYDATKEMHLEAKDACMKCPVIEQCLRDRMLKNTDPSAVAGGVYGGLMWDIHAGVAAMDIEEWHKIHKVGGQFRNRDSHKRFEPGWTEERTCRNPSCSKTFMVTSRNHCKQFHSVACRRRYKQVYGKFEAA